MKAATWNCSSSVIRAIAWVTWATDMQGICGKNAVMATGQSSLDALS